MHASPEWSVQVRTTVGAPRNLCGKTTSPDACGESCHKFANFRRIHSLFPLFLLVSFSLEVIFGENLHPKFAPRSLLVSCFGWVQALSPGIFALVPSCAEPVAASRIVQQPSNPANIFTGNGPVRQHEAEPEAPQ